MKVSSILSALILAMALLIGWQEHTQLAALRMERDNLTRQAIALGISAGLPGDAENDGRSAIRERGDKRELVREAVAEIAAVLREMERRKEEGLPHDLELQDRILGGLELLRSLDSEQLIGLTEEFRDAGGLGEDSRRLVLAVAIDTLVDRDPHAALELITGDGGSWVSPEQGPAWVMKALNAWAGLDPAGALAWLRAKPVDFMAHGSAELSVIAGTARADLALAFRLVDELGIEDPGPALAGIARELKDPQRRTEMLNLLRNAPAEWEQADVRQALVHVASGIGSDGFDKGTLWMEESGLAAREMEPMFAGIVEKAEGAEKGDWIEWMGGRLPPEVRDRRIGEAVSRWTEVDHRAAGQWLSGLPEGAAKAPAVEAFARTVAPHDPEAAARWALTLPPGPQRKGTLEAVYEAWPREDAAARDAFMTRHPAE